MRIVNDAQIQGWSLYDVEREKLNRLERRLASTFLAAGYFNVSICHGDGSGELRILTFRCGSDFAPVVSFSSLAFLISTGGELCRMITSYLSHISPTIATDTLSCG